MLQTKEDNPTGLHAKYFIQKIKGYKYKGNGILGPKYEPILEPVKDNAEYFILRLDENGEPNHVKASKKAILIYADEIEKYAPDLAANLRERYKI